MAVEADSLRLKIQDQADFIIWQDAELRKAKGRLDYLETVYQIEERPWYEKVVKSSFFDFVYFVAGVIIGRAMVKVYGGG